MSLICSDLIFVFHDDSIEKSFCSLNYFISFLKTRYAVCDQSLSVYFDNSNDFFLIITETSFLHYSPDLHSFNSTKSLIHQSFLSDLNGGIEVKPDCIDFDQFKAKESDESDKCYCRIYLADYFKSHLDLNAISEKLNKEINNPNIFSKANSSTIHMINREFPKLKNLNLLTNFFWDQNNGSLYSLKTNENFLESIKSCKVLKTIAATTRWEDDTELKILMSVCQYLDIQSYRWLCYGLGVLNKLIHRSDRAFQEYEGINYNIPLCNDLNKQFGCGCKLDCGVTTPIALSFKNIKGPHLINYIEDQGWLYLTTNDNPGPNFKTKLCKKFFVTGVVRDEFYKNWGCSLYFKFNDESSPRPMIIEKRMVIKTDEILKKEFFSKLDKLGVQIQNGRSKQVQDSIRKYIFHCVALKSATSPQFKEYEATFKSGWHDKFYVSPINKVISYQDDVSESNPFQRLPEEILYYKPRGILNPFVQKGTMIKWANEYIAPKKTPPPPVLIEKLLICGISLLPLRLKSDNLPSCIFHIWGQNKKDRSRALRLAASIWGDPDKFIYKIGYIEKNIEKISLLHNDSLICVSEISEQSYQQYLRLIYRLTFDEIPFKTADIITRHVLLSSGEEPILLSKKRGGSSPPIVINIRINEITSKNDVLEGMESFGCVTGEALKTISSESYGVPRPFELNFHKEFNSFVNSMFSKKNKLLKETIRKVSFHVLKLSRITAEKVYHDHFFDNLGDSFKNRLFDYLNQSLDNRSEKEKEALITVKQYLENHGYPKLINEDIFTPDVNYVVDGYFIKIKKRVFALILTERFNELFCKNISKKRMAQLLFEDGILKSGKNGSLSTSKWIKGLRKSRRGYLLKLSPSHGKTNL